MKFFEPFLTLEIQGFNLHCKFSKESLPQTLLAHDCPNTMEEALEPWVGWGLIVDKLHLYRLHGCDRENCFAHASSCEREIERWKKFEIRDSLNSEKKLRFEGRGARWWKMEEIRREPNKKDKKIGKKKEIELAPIIWSTDCFFTKPQIWPIRSDTFD